MSREQLAFSFDEPDTPQPYTLTCADVLTWAQGYTGEKFHAMLLDGPYGLGFMGKQWDRPATFFERKAERRNGWDHVGGNHNPVNAQDAVRTYQSENEALQAWYTQVFKALAQHLLPGAFIMAFASSRGFHRVMTAMEDAGLRLYPSIFGWLTGSSFPKATRIDRAIDAAAGVEQPIIGHRDTRSLYDGAVRQPGEKFTGVWNGGKVGGNPAHDLTAPATPLAQTWAGHRYGGQMLKNSLEPIIVAQVPYAGKPVQSIVEHGSGALWIDGARLATASDDINARQATGVNGGASSMFGVGNHARPATHTHGRWPANFCMSHLSLPVVRLQAHLPPETIDAITRYYAGYTEVITLRAGRNGAVHHGLEVLARDVPDGWLDYFELTGEDLGCVQVGTRQVRGSDRKNGSDTSENGVNVSIVQNAVDGNPGVGQQSVKSDIPGLLPSSTVMFNGIQFDHGPQLRKEEICDETSLFSDKDILVNERYSTQTQPFSNQQLNNGHADLSTFSNRMCPISGHALPIVQPSDDATRTRAVEIPVTPRETRRLDHKGGSTDRADAVDPRATATNPHLLGTSGTACLRDTVDGRSVLDGVMENCSTDSARNVNCSHSIDTIHEHDGTVNNEEVPAWHCAPGCVVAKLDAQAGVRSTGKPTHGTQPTTDQIYGHYSQRSINGGGDTGNASRFFYVSDFSLDVAEQLAQADPVFYCAKASRGERDKGLEGMPLQYNDWQRETSGLSQGKNPSTGERSGNRCTPAHNPHPTVKPLALCRWLATLLLPPAAYAPRRLLNVFSGTGSEAIGALLAGWDEVMLVEQDASYVALAEPRLAYWHRRMAGGV